LAGQPVGSTTRCHVKPWLSAPPDSRINCDSCSSSQVTLYIMVRPPSPGPLPPAHANRPQTSYTSFLEKIDKILQGRTFTVGVHRWGAGHAARTRNQEVQDIKGVKRLLGRSRRFLKDNIKMLAL
jgi:hypothetical protein